VRRTKILATLGPASSRRAVLEAMVAAGMDGVRLNLSHGSHREHAQRAHAARRAAAAAGRPLALVLDLAGPKIRTAGPVRGEVVEIPAGAGVTFVGRAVAATPQRIGIALRHLEQRVRAGERILLDDGRMQFRVERIRGEEVHCRVEVGGTLRARRGVSLPDSRLELTPLTRKDERDLAFGLELGVDYVAQSFVARAGDVRVLQRAIQRHAAHVPIIAKLERRSALHQLDAILDVADGVMVARGDLGVEIPVERVPAAQKYILARAGERGRLAITATEMLETMIERDVPTRAEVSDVANAVYDGTDVLMLSGETAIGKHPAAAVGAMHRIALAAESPLRPTRWTVQYDASRAFTSVLAGAAQKSATQVTARALVVVTGDGKSALVASKHRPSVPVFAVASRPEVLRRAALFWGVTPWRHSLRRATERLMHELETALREAGHVRGGDVVAYLGGSHAWGAVTDMVRLTRVAATIAGRGRRGSR
jgi:pyruvate kinase